MGDTNRHVVPYHAVLFPLPSFVSEVLIAANTILIPSSKNSRNFLELHAAFRTTACASTEASQIPVLARRVRVRTHVFERNAIASPLIIKATKPPHQTRGVSILS
jgi:hypothetical protein